MRIYIPCSTCIEQVGEANDPTGALLRAYPAPFTEAGVYRTRCDNGHEATTLVTQPAAFELLAETAAQAIVDGYYRDAVTSFAAALERFREFYVRAIAISRKVDQESFDLTWKEVAVQSERQFGWYCGLYLMENGSAPPPMSRWYVDTRNDVVHKGRIPTEADALKFGQAVFDHLAPILLDLRHNHHESLTQLFHQRSSAAQRRLRVGEPHGYFYSVWIVDWMIEGGKYERTVEACISQRRILDQQRTEKNLTLLRAQLAGAAGEA